MAERSTFSTIGATAFFVKVTVFSASSTPRPLIRSSTSRAFCGDTRWKRASARNSRVSNCIGLPQTFFNLCQKLLRLGCRLRSLRRVSLKRARCRELTQLVTHHVLRHIHRHKFLAVVDRNRVPHKL